MNLIHVGLLIVFLVFIISLIKIWENFNQKKQEEYLKIIQSFYRDLELLKQQYISELDKQELKDKYQNLRNKITCFKEEQFIYFKNYYDMLDKNIDDLNEDFISKEMIKCKEYFDNIFKYPIDDDQRKAIITDDNNNLIIAGAGSGKTTTIIGKTKYLIDKKNIKPEEIITISFTNASKDNFIEKLNDKRVYCSTFHKLGKDILEDGSEKLDIAKEGYLEEQIEKYIHEEMIKDKEETINFINFYSYYLHLIDENNDKKFEEIIEDIQGLDLETLKYKFNKFKGLTTIKNEKVKSEQELIIANFLFLNGINYEYEQKYKYKTANDKYRQYHPDFYLTDYDIYLEHFGINKDFKAPQYNEIEEQKYLDGIIAKREIHKQNNTKLIETYSYDFDNYNIEHVLTKKLQEQGIELKQINYNEIIEFLSKTKSDDMIAFYKLVNKFIKMFKGNNYTLDKFDDFYMDALKNKNTRNVSLIKIIKNIYMYYQANLIKDEYIDFDDMINLAAKKVNENYTKKISYIIIDEFQDVSYSRYLLVKAIQNKTNAKVIAVGDDWQSIYRFSGCDLDLFVNFKKYFNKPKIMYIKNTYRNSQNLINLSSSFIMKNEKGQIRKSIISNVTNIDNPIEFIYLKEDYIKATKQAIENLRKIGCKSIAILGRNNLDIKNYKVEPNNTKKEIKIDKLFGEGVVFTTVHKSKGLEFDGVIICNLKNYITGFPNKMSDDPILNYVTISKDDYLYEEERRLFYVALTRTKTKCILLVPITNPSVFVEELYEISKKTIKKTIIEDDERLHNPKCPKCNKGIIVTRVNGKDGSEFVGCSNYPICDFKYKSKEIIKNSIKCPKCNSYMVKRSGPRGSFYGCINYPYCNQTIENDN